MTIQFGPIYYGDGTKLDSKQVPLIPDVYAAGQNQLVFTLRCDSTSVQKLQDNGSYQFSIKLVNLDLNKLVFSWYQAQGYAIDNGSSITVFEKVCQIVLEITSSDDPKKTEFRFKFTGNPKGDLGWDCRSYIQNGPDNGRLLLGAKYEVHIQKQQTGGTFQDLTNPIELTIAQSRVLGVASNFFNVDGKTSELVGLQNIYAKGYDAIKKEQDSEKRESAGLAAVLAAAKEEEWSAKTGENNITDRFIPMAFPEIKKLSQTITTLGNYKTTENRKITPQGINSINLGDLSIPKAKKTEKIYAEICATTLQTELRNKSIGSRYAPGKADILKNWQASAICIQASHGTKSIPKAASPNNGWTGIIHVQGYNASQATPTIIFKLDGTISFDDCYLALFLCCYGGMHKGSLYRSSKDRDKTDRLYNSLAKRAVQQGCTLAIGFHGAVQLPPFYRFTEALFWKDPKGPSPSIYTGEPILDALKRAGFASIQTSKIDDGDTVTSESLGGKPVSALAWRIYYPKGIDITTETLFPIRYGNNKYQGQPILYAGYKLALDPYDKEKNYVQNFEYENKKLIFEQDVDTGLKVGLQQQREEDDSQ